MFGFLDAGEEGGPVLLKLRALKASKQPEPPIMDMADPVKGSGFEPAWLKSQSLN